MRDPQDPWQDERTARHGTPDQLWAARQHQRAITDCNLCDTNGLIDGFTCDHTNHAETAKRHMAQIRAQMGWPAPTTPTTP